MSSFRTPDSLLQAGPAIGRRSATLQFKTGKTNIQLNALGLLQTELPDNPDTYSLLLLITATFNPIQLGLGFALNGIGGLIGVNRSANLTYLRGLVYSGNLDRLLFPSNVLDNPQEAITIADSSFPATESRYVFGLMAKISWGTPTLLILDVALIIELPAPVRLLLIGVLRAVLPDLNNPILQLRADFLGSVDFGAKRVEFDAVLTQSSLLQFALTGNGIFRMYQGENPVFLLSAGGFHPSFRPPANANLPTPQRLALNLANGNDFRVFLEAYFAITSNTVQIGAHLGLYVNLGYDFTVEGYAYFDTLIQFNPFQLETEFAIGLALKFKGKDKLSLHVRLHVTGPAPWHISGEVVFTLIVEFSFRIDHTFGGSKVQSPLPDIDVRKLLQTALEESRNWEVEALSNLTPTTVALRANPAQTNLLIDPSGTLLVRQNIIPLMTRLERYGNSRPLNGNWFEITKIELGTTSFPLVLQRQDFESVEDFFAIGEFQQLNNASRLSAPSFQLMRSGVRLKSLVGFTGGSATVQKVGYELIVLPTLIASVTLSERRSTVDMTKEQFQQLLPNSTIGRNAEKLTESYQSADQVYWKEDEYVIILAANLTRYNSELYSNEASAAEALDTILEANPSMSEALLVVPAYQIELESV